MPTPQGARRGGGDWDANAADLERWVEPDPGERCKAYRVGDRPIVPGEPLEAWPDGLTDVQLADLRIGPRCTNTAPVGSSICTPCHRARIADTARRRSLAHRQRIAEQTGRPLESIE